MSYTRDWWLEAACWVRLVFLEQVSPLEDCEQASHVRINEYTYTRGHP